MKTKLQYFCILLALFTGIISPPFARGDGSFKTLVSFTFTNAPNYGASGGYERTGSMVQGDDGNFYGTTPSGEPPDANNLSGTFTYGTVFKMTPAGTFTSIYFFDALAAEYSGAPLDGQWPVGNLINGTDGNLYGTAPNGGAYAAGTVFQIMTNGALTVIYSFGGNAGFEPAVGWTNYDGNEPLAGVVQGTDGNFYGTTASDGAYGQGTVFQLTPGGVLMTLHSFTNLNDLGQNVDGAKPEGELVEGDDGNFYGTATSGGADACGTIFRITPAGAYDILVSFNGTNGFRPVAGLCKGNDGNFYGTTYGAPGNYYSTVFQMTTNGVLTTLHQFQFAGETNDGDEPVAKLIQGSDGKFYGTTTGNTVFQITTNGTFAVLHTFSGLDGLIPRASLVQGADGNFYGTTSGGGAHGYGTIFSITIPPAFQSVTQTNGMFNFTWSIVPGQTYQLQSNTNLSSTNWLNLGSSVTATNTTAGGSDSTTNSQCFYRIMLLQ